MSKDAYWFPHDANAHGDKALIRLRRKFGYASDGMFWLLIELLRNENENDYELPLYSIDDLIYEHRLDNEIIKAMFEGGENSLLKKNDTMFWSDSLKRRMRPLDEKRRRLSEAGKKGGRPLKKREALASLKPGLNQEKGRPKPAESNKRREEKNIVDKKRERKKTSAHTLPKDWKPNDSHRELAKKHSINIDWEADKMRDWAQSKGAKKKDWNATFRNWLRDKIPAPTPDPMAHLSEEEQREAAEIDRLMLANPIK